MDIDNTTKKGTFVVFQNNRVVGVADSLEQARLIKEDEIKKDQLQLLLKKRILKKLLKSGKGLITDQYFICEVIEV